MTSAAPPRDTSEIVASNGTGIADKVPSSRARPRARRLRFCRDDCRRHRAVLLSRARPRRAALARRGRRADEARAVNRWLGELWLLGAGAIAFVLFFASLLHVPWSRWMVIAALIAIVLVALLVRERVRPEWPHPIDAVAALAVLGY